MSRVRQRNNLRRFLAKESGMRCHYCNREIFNRENSSPGQFTMDRIVPGAFGGRYTRLNTVACCYKCNHEFGDLLDKCGCDKCLAAWEHYAMMED